MCVSASADPSLNPSNTPLPHPSPLLSSSFSFLTTCRASFFPLSIPLFTPPCSRVFSGRTIKIALTDGAQEFDCLPKKIKTEPIQSQFQILEQENLSHSLQRSIYFQMGALFRDLASDESQVQESSLKINESCCRRGPSSFRSKENYDMPVSPLSRRVK